MLGVRPEERMCSRTHNTLLHCRCGFKYLFHHPSFWIGCGQNAYNVFSCGTFRVILSLWSICSSKQLVVGNIIRIGSCSDFHACTQHFVLRCSSYIEPFGNPGAILRECLRHERCHRLDSLQHFHSLQRHGHACAQLGCGT